MSLKIVASNPLHSHIIESAVDAFPSHLQQQFADNNVKIVVAGKGQATTLMPEFQYDISVDPYGAAKMREITKSRGADFRNSPTAETLRATKTILVSNDFVQKHIVVHELGHIVDFIYAMPNAPIYPFLIGPDPNIDLSEQQDFLHSALSFSEAFGLALRYTKTFSFYEATSRNPAEAFAESVRMFTNTSISTDEKTKMMLYFEQTLLKHTNSVDVQQALTIQAPQVAYGLKNIFTAAVKPGENPFA